MSRFYLLALPAMVVLMMGSKTLLAKDQVAGNLIQFNENGAWCWYQDPRLVIDKANGTLLISSIAAGEGVGGKDRGGDVDIVTYDFAAGQSTRSTLHPKFEPQDDHNAAAILIRPDGRYLAVYARHNHDNFTYWRISTHPHDATEWGPEQSFDWTSAIQAAKAHSHVTYSNLFYLPTEGKTYDFSRAINDDPSILISSNNGDNWNYAGKLLTEEKLGYVNGYTKYAQNGPDRIDFITTEHHPRDFNNSIYHGYVQNGKLHDSNGNVIDDNIFDSQGHSQTELTRVFAANSMFDGTIMTHAWTIQLAIDSSGNPYGVISARADDQPENSNFNDHRFFFIRFDGSKWHVNQLAKAGACLWPAEQDYTGLATVDPSNPNVVFISTTIDPRTGSSLAVHEIFRGQSSDAGQTWNWSALTSDSSVDNLRPLAVAHGDSTVLVWFRGTMSRSQHYDSAMVGLILGDQEPTQAVTFVPTDPAKPQNIRVSPGTYNVFAYFWSDASADSRLSAGLSSDRMMVYRPRSAQAAEASQFAQLMKTVDGNRLLYRAFLGREKVDEGGTLNVTAGSSSDSAAVAGIGYQLVN